MREKSPQFSKPHITEVLMLLDNLGDIGLSEMIGTMRLHVQEVVRFIGLIAPRLRLSRPYTRQFHRDIESAKVNSKLFIRKNGKYAVFTPLGIYLLKVCAKLHDIGKPLFRPLYALERNFSEEEFRKQQLHAHFSRIIVKSFQAELSEKCQPFLNFVGDMGAAHQEKYNGTGYPDHLQGDSIGVIGRILCIVDAISAMMTPRHYVAPKTLEECLWKIKNDSIKHFDPYFALQIVDILKPEANRMSGNWENNLHYLSEDYRKLIRNISLHNVLLNSGDRERFSDIEKVLSGAV